MKYEIIKLEKAGSLRLIPETEEEMQESNFQKLSELSEKKEKSESLLGDDIEVIDD